jgi:hypothetical protein
MGYNPNPVHWLDVSPASFYIEAKRNKGSKMWHTKTITKQQQQKQKQ